jgi:hypothetical protein
MSSRASRSASCVAIMVLFDDPLGAAFGNAVFPHRCEPAPGFDAFARGHRHEAM